MSKRYAYTGTKEQMQKSLTEAAKLENKFTMLITMNENEDGDVAIQGLNYGHLHAAGLIHGFLSIAMQELGIHPADIYESLVEVTAEMLKSREGGESELPSVQ